MMSRDGERLLVAVPPTQLRQLTVFDRTGKVVSTVGSPGLYVQPGISPDGKRVVVMRNGRLVADVSREQATQESLLRLMAGVESPAAA